MNDNEFGFEEFEIDEEHVVLEEISREVMMNINWLAWKKQ